MVGNYFSKNKIAMGSWSGGRFMHFGEMLSEEDYISLFQLSYQMGIRTFVTSDVYGSGKADCLIGEALREFPRSSYQLVGMIGHDFHEAKREGNRGYPRFTSPDLRSPEQYESFVIKAVEESLTRCKTDYFDLLLLHNPDEIGYTNPAVWEALAKLKATGLTKQLGIAPGPANGFTLDLIHCFRSFGQHIDWCMAILNPLEPWPVNHILHEAEAQDIRIMTRVADFGGVLFGGLADDHEFSPGDHRNYRPDGWVKQANQKAKQLLPFCEKYNVSLIQLSALWSLSFTSVECVVPSFIREKGETMQSLHNKVLELISLPNVTITKEDHDAITSIGENTGCMLLKGASSRHSESLRPDEWPIRAELLEIAEEIGWNTHW